ncbi:probably inactive leucine-rich repeat receptor-like protein kinase At5g06940 [Coffea eugenioides]|uniref:probably inactive leucine-rich repeat receptor-like protein kinase At5g06940 n=1 Tax=Coffea eugenioides TaxID=49369 RepID=UPI000F60A73B|nr:probably inactive leucine-rich repeat receptor-like protein kinase At5g06940 [Coffea eugenioides]
MAIFSRCFVLLSFSFSFFLLASASSEADILLSFKDSIEDVSNTLSSWSNTTAIHHCNWTGVTCTNTFPQNVYFIDLQSMNLSGEISPSICQLPNLTNLNLADNLFNQAIPLHLSLCASLETLNISNNLIWGTIPEQISQFQFLKVLDFSRNHIEGKIPEGIGLLNNLQVLNLGGNLLTGSVPMVIGNCSELVVLDISQNPFLLSEIPADIGKLNKLEMLLLQSSGFYGQIPNIFEGLKSLSILDLSVNNLTGSLPPIGMFLPNLVSFDVSQNKLFGPFPNGICEAKDLANLGLYSNSFNGSVPNDLIKECSSLERFQVQNNMFTGNFPSWLWSLPKLKLIRAENNRFSGEIPDSISKATLLEQVQIDNNSFVSKVPQGLGLVSSLYRFSASQNKLYGELPPNFCDSPVMSIMNFSHNYLSGGFPEVKKCRKLVSLSLADNNLIGEIPQSLADLPVLTYLDLSHNNLSGPIPGGLQNLKLALFNVSFNRLSGRVPLSLISGLPASFLQGNPDLCGPGLPNTCSDDQSRHRTANLSKLTGALSSIALVFVVAIVAFGVYVLRQSHKQKSQMDAWKSVFFYPMRINEHDLIMAMDEKAARGDGGAFGQVYIVNLPNGESVAVKRLENFRSQSFKALKTEVKTLAKIRHRNIVKILGFCHNDDSLLLIYENISRGSLGDVIRKPDSQLPWTIRLRIAIGVAQGLAYLHQDYLPRLLHRNIKSRNILLDADFEPKLTDFALDRIVGETAYQLSLASGSEKSCYIPPEYGHTKKATEQSDAYSFGVVLLELVTGRQAEQPAAMDSLNVVKWVRRKINLKNGAVQLLDPKISQNCQQAMLAVLEIAVQCTNVVPEKRPRMSEVLKALQSINSRNSLASKELSSSGESSVHF